MIGSADELLLTCEELGSEIERLGKLGARLDVIYPADEPHTAILQHRGRTVRLTTRPDAPQPGDVRKFRAEFVMTPAGASPSEGRAGMLYRDLIPSRLGGRYIASHIGIPAGGPVLDWVHFHRIALQLIHVRKGWVRLVYEDQGDPFVMHPGDLVLQPPGIRHRVLESSAGLEVLEIGCPALHETFADHEMELPTGKLAPNRDFAGQRFLHHVAAEASWTPFHGAEAQQMRLVEASGGMAEARTIRPTGSKRIELPAHDGELIFGFVLDGSARLQYRTGFNLGPADAFVIPPGEGWSLSDASPDFRLFHVATRKID